MNDFEQALHRCDLAKRPTKTVKKEADTLMAHYQEDRRTKNCSHEEAKGNVPEQGQDLAG